MRLFLVCLNIYSTTWESDRKERNVSSVCWFLSSDPLVYVGAGLGALVLIFTVVLFIFIKLKQKRRSSGLTSSAHRPDLYLTYCQCTIRQSELFLRAVYQKTQMQCENLWDVWNKSKWMGRNSLFTCSNSTPVTHHWSKLSHLFQSL